MPTPKRPSKPLGKNTLYKLLTNPYYAGVIRYKGALHPGAHDPIVEPELFDKVQSLLRARTAKMTRHVQHAHHLKGLLHCGTCGSRMLLDFATNPRGTTYAYFVCSGRAAKKTNCTRRAVPVAVAERLVADSYASITISDATYQRLAADVDAAFDKRNAGQDQEVADLTASRARLEAESDKLLAAHFADAIDLDTLKRHQDRIRAGLADVNRRLAEHSEHHTGGRAFLHDSLRLLTDAHRAYQHSGDADRRLANQAFYTRLDITDDEQLRARLAEPFATIFREAHDGGDGGKEAKREHTTSSDVACSRKTLWVGLFSSHANELRKAHRHLSTDPVRELPQENRHRKRSTQPRLSDEKVSQIVTAYETGKTVYELAAEYGCHRVTISAVLKRQGVPIRHRSPTPTQIAEMARLYESGLSLAKVGEHFGFHASTVLAHLRNTGVKTRAHHQREH